MSNTFVNAVLDVLIENNLKDKVSDKQHVKSVWAAKREKDNLINQRICPKCGGMLVLRKGRYGEFYGCSNYPNCKFTLK